MVKKIISIILITAIIFTFAIVMLKGDNKKEDLTNKLYNKMVENNEYSFLMQNNNNYKTIISKKQDNVSIDMYAENYHTTTLTKSDGTYVLMHDEKEYSFYETDDAGADILTDELYNLKGKEYKVGKEKINNETYKYEEYEGFSAFSTMTNKELNEEETKTKFYFDKENNLKYIKTIIQDEEEMLEIQVTYSVDDEIFEIPSDYAEL